MSNNEVITNTSQWSLVVQRVTDTTAEIWVGTLFATLKKPTKARVELTSSSGTVKRKEIKKEEWQRPFTSLDQRFYQVVTFTGLTPGETYSVKFSRFIDKGEEQIIPVTWQELRSGSLTTLPQRLPLKGTKPFTVSLSSCFYNHRDGGRAAAAYKALHDWGPENTRPDIKFMTGDQVYLDIGFDSLSLIPQEIHQRIADDYATHWQALGSILTRGGTWMLPDDHEYWNDYPFYESNIPTLQALRIDKVRKAWDAASKDGVNNVQRSPQFEIFSIGNDISFCLADLRSFRDDHGFTSTAIFNKIQAWAAGLTSPGVFVSPQPLIVEENEQEKNLLSYKEQYAALLKAFASSGHDIVLLSGDVHFGRIASVPLTADANGPRLIEIIASPLSNLTFLNGIATAKPKLKPKTFPAAEVCRINRCKAQPVSYSEMYQVSTKKGNIFSAYPRTRTNEHFMTVGFSRLEGGDIEICADAWKVRMPEGRKKLPSKDFQRSYRTRLK